MTRLNINFGFEVGYERKYDGELHNIRDLLESQGFHAFYFEFTTPKLRKKHPNHNVFEDAVPGRTRIEAERVLRHFYGHVIKPKLLHRVKNNISVLSSSGINVAIDILFRKLKV